MQQEDFEMTKEAENKLISFLNRKDITAEMIDTVFERRGRDIGKKIGELLLQARELSPFRTIDDIRAVEGIGEKRLALMLEAAGKGWLEAVATEPDDPGNSGARLNLAPYLETMKVPISVYASTDFEFIAEEDVGKLLRREECMKAPKYMVVQHGRNYWIIERCHRRFHDQLLHIVTGKGSQKLAFSKAVSCDTSAASVLAGICRTEARSLILLDDGIVVGVVPPQHLVKIALPLLAGMDVVEKEVNTGTSDTPSQQYTAVPCEGPCKCAIILFEVAPGPVGTPIDSLTGGKGYSHAAVDCCEKDEATGERLMIDITLSNGVHRTPIDSERYRGRARARIELSGADCEELCNCMKRKVGSGFDWTDFWREDGEGDPEGTVCSQTIFECLSPGLQERIRKAWENVYLGFWGELNRKHNPGLVSPNQIAHAFCAPNGKEIEGTVNVPSAPRIEVPAERQEPPIPVTPPPPSPRRCHVKVRLIRVRFKDRTDEIGTDWLFHFDVNGRGPGVLRAPDFSKSTQPLTPRKLLFDEERGVCGGRVEINIIIKAWQYDGVNDYGTAETDTPWIFECPGQHIRDMELNITDWNDNCWLQFRFEVELVCV